MRNSANETATFIQVLQFLDLEMPLPNMLGKTLSIEGNRGLQNIHSPLRKRLTGYPSDLDHQGSLLFYVLV